MRACMLILNNNWILTCRLTMTLGERGGCERQNWLPENNMRDARAVGRERHLVSFDDATPRLRHAKMSLFLASRCGSTRQFTDGG